MCSQNYSRLRMISHGLAAGLFALAIMMTSSLSFAEDNIATLRTFDLTQQPTPPDMPKPSFTELREVRNYPEQPPVIPHKIRGYRIDLNSNKCMSCHSRKAVGLSQAPMVSVTHFMNRVGQVLSVVTAQRYFCHQCHVPQLSVSPLVENMFIDADDLSSGQ